MSKIKISILVEVEFEVDPRNYPYKNTLDDILALEIDNADQDPELFMSMDDAKFTVTGVIV